MAAWPAIEDDPDKRARYQKARGKGGFRRTSWDEALELVAAATIHTSNKHGTDRIIGFTPIPAMSKVSYAAGTRFLTLLGGVKLTFYRRYCDLPSHPRNLGRADRRGLNAPTGITPTSSP